MRFRPFLVALGVFSASLGFAFVSPHMAHADISSGLVGYWNFDEGSGTIAADSSGNSHAGSLSGGATWTAGKIGGGAVQFGGSGQTVTASDIGSLGTSFSISFWFKTTAGPTAAIVGLGRYRDCRIDYGPAGSLACTLNGGGSIISAGQAVNDGSWHQGVFVTAPSGSTLYVDGSLKASAALVSTESDPNPVTVGDRFFGGAVYVGSVDDLRIYTRALSSSDISELYAYTGGSSGGGGTVTPPPSDPTPPVSDTTAPVISSVASGSLTSSGATVSWSTNESADSQIEYGLTTGYGNSTSLDASQVTFHSVSLSSLSANTLYHYRVKSRDASGNLAIGNDNTFTTSAVVTPPVSPGAHTFYIDAANGSDSNSGTSKAAPWKKAPGMAGFSGSYAHQAGDHFIFKGGVTWPSSAFPLNVTSGGSASAGNDYYGVDMTWYAGGSWTRPVFDGAYQVANIFSLGSLSYVTIDNLELEHVNSNATSWGYGLISGGGNSNILIENSYLHGWRTGFATDDAHGGVIFSYFGPGIDTIVVDHCDFSNLENTGAYNGMMVRMAGVVKNSSFHDNDSAAHFMMDFDNNTLYNITGIGFDPTYHTNGVYLDPASIGQSVGYIRHNSFHDVGGGANMAYPNVRSGDSIYIYDNIFYGEMSAQMAINIDPFQYSSEGPGSVYIYNNTVVNFWSNGGAAIHVTNRGANQPVKNLAIFNNHVIGTNTPLTDASASDVMTLTQGNNLIQSPAVASGQGYALGNLYKPTAASNSTVDAGVRESMFNDDLLRASRPQGSAWDIGAYEYAGSGSGGGGTTPPADTTAPSVPANVSASAVSTSAIDLDWTASTDAVGVTGYKIYRGGALIGTATTNSYSDSGLSASTQYSYAVAAYDAAGNTSARSSASSATTQSVSAPADTTAPAVSITAPSNGATVSGSSVVLSASASDNVGVAGVQFKLGGSNLGSELTIAPYSGTWNTVGVSNGSHTLTAVARDAAGNTKTSNSVTVTVSNSTADTSAPSTPTGITSSSLTQTRVTLSWLAAVDNVGVSGYKVFRNGVLIASPTANTYAVTGLSANTLYTFTVSAYDAAGNESSLSLPLVVTTAAIPVTTFALSASKSGSGTGSITGNGLNCGSTCSVSITNGTTVTLTATPSSDSTFDGWSGACTGTGSCSTTVTAAKSVSAMFTLIPVTTPVTPPASGGGGGSSSGSSSSGTVISSPTGIFTPTVPQAPAVSTPVRSTTGIILTKNLYQGLTDPEVKTLQTYLISQGYLGGTATGYFGPLTEAGVMRYQAAHNITQTGTIGPITRASLAVGGGTSVSTPVSTSTSIPAFTRSLTLGSTGSDVRYLQIFLNKHGFQVSLSGAGSPNNETTYFGPATARALAKFQLAKGISPAVGYFGPLTMKAVNSIK